MQKIRYIATLLLLWSITSSAQFGDEWINYNQSYIKLKIAEDGFYRVSAAELEAAGFPTGSVPASRIQLFRRGQEVAIQVNATSNVLNYLEFYAEKNKGEGDTELYAQPQAQPHTEYNIFTDTAAYFLTWKLVNETGKRIAFSNLNDASGLTAQPFHIEEDLSVEASRYASGIKFGSGSSFTLSDYDFGEGWTGNSVAKGGFKDFTLTLENVNSSSNPELEVVLIGENTLDHNVDILVGPNTSSLRNIGNVQFSDRNFETASFSFLNSDIGAGGALTVRVLTTGFAGAADRVSTALLRVNYSQNVTMLNTENKQFNFEGLGGTERAYVRIFETGNANTDVFEITDPLTPIRLSTTHFSDRLECIIPVPNSERSILAVNAPMTVPDIESVTFVEPNISASDYLILTHSALRQPASDGLDPVQAFVDYRASVQGGQFTSSVFDIFDVYDQFNYGDISSLAIRRLADYALSNGNPQAIFLIGKGRTPDENFYRTEGFSVVNIPTFGTPGSDLMFVSGLGAVPLDPAIPIGRLNAFTNEDVKAYLDKVKEMESLPYNDLFRKNVLQLSGGQTTAELSVFKLYINDFKRDLEGDYLGGKAINVGKRTSQEVEVVDVVQEINDGVGLVTFFGHSSGAATDIEIGRVTDGEFGYNNPGKYPIFLVNGCNAGDIFGDNFTFGEDWMRADGLGAIGFIAHADFASASNLKRWSDIFYQVGFMEENLFGSTLGEIILECSERYFDSYGSSDLARTQVFQMLLQGDPMIRLFAAEQPDYEITDEDLSAEAFTATPLLAALDSFKVNLPVKNYGRTVNDSLLVQVRRTLPQGEIVDSFKKFLRPLRLDTLEFPIYNEIGLNVVGSNTIEVFLDPNNETPELNEGNNYASFTIQIFEGNTINLYPPQFSVQSASSSNFIWQPADIFESSRSYDIQIDTVATFDSPILRSLIASGERLLSRQVDFSGDNLPDTTVVYWRTRFTNPENAEEEEWANSSFSIIPTADTGWGQFQRNQVNKNSITGVEYTADDAWQFVETDAPVNIVTFGNNYPSFNYDDLVVVANGIDYLATSNTSDPECAQNTINAVIFDKESTNPYRPIDFTGNDGQITLLCGRLPQLVYNFTEADVTGVDAYLEQVIDLMEIGDHIVLFNIGLVNYSNWDIDVLNALETVGISGADISALTNGQPLIALGRKGDSPGTATIVSTDGSPDPVTEQSIELNDIVNGSYSSGVVSSVEIGPVKSWDSFTYLIESDVNDDFVMNLKGITPEGQEMDLFAFSRSDNQDLSSIDPIAFPRMRIEYSFLDDIDLTPPFLKYWQLNYEPAPDGILFSDDLETSEFQEGAQAQKSLFFYNYSNEDFLDSLDVIARLRSSVNANIQTQNFRIDGPLSGDTVTVSTAVNTIGQDGLNSLSVEIDAIENEQYQFNNRLTLNDAVNVLADNTNPFLDVTFDGAYIMNGDIVSPESTIVIRMKDDNSFLLKNDTIGVEIQLKRPCEGCVFERINFSDPTVTVSPATENTDFEITMNPNLEEDGVYTLSAQARDESGNLAGTEPYQVEFEVVSESSITHFYPYPNPFSTQTRFVFTLTGTNIPEKIKIQIMTISGRIVREINQDEIGPIKIGHNITQFAWDGTDRYGDQLANGVYFYRVLMQSGAESIEHRETSADGAFKNGFGKLYILR